MSSRKLSPAQQEFSQRHRGASCPPFANESASNAPMASDRLDSPHFEHPLVSSRLSSQTLQSTRLQGTSNKESADPVSTPATTAAPTPAILYSLTEAPLPLPLQQQLQSQQGGQRSRVGVDLTYEEEETTCCFTARLFFRNAWRTLKMWRLFLQLSATDVRQRPCAFCLGMFSVIVVVLMCVVMLSILSALPIVFLLLGEASYGMIDLELTAGGLLSVAQSLNYTTLAGFFPPSGDVDLSYHTPRISFSVSGSVLDRCSTTDTYKKLWATNTTSSGFCDSDACVRAKCHSYVSATLIAFDSEKENRMQLGEAADRFNAPQDGYAIISRRVALLLGGLRVGDDIFFYGETLKPLAQTYAGLNISSAQAFVIMSLTVQDIVGARPTKLPEGGDNFVLVNYKYINRIISRSMRPDTRVRNVQRVAAANPYHGAGRVLFNLPPGHQRTFAYQSSSFNTIRRRVMDWANPIVTRSGFNQVNVRAPLVSALYTTRMFSVFVGLIMSIILLALAFLSIMLIYSLLTVGIETRTYELGIQRMVGFTRENLVAYVLSNAYFFAIPAWLIGLGAGQGVYIVVSLIFKKITNVVLPLAVAGSAVGWATMAGLLIPLVASVFPIRSLLTLRLSEAIDASRGRNTGVVYKIVRNDVGRINGVMLGLGFMFALFGFLLYYLFPSSLINMNLSLMFYIFFFVLLGMLAGLTLLATNFQRVVETVLLYVFFFWESRPVFRMTRKSLAAHRLRNRKTALMYSLSLAFIIFITVAFDIQLTAIVYDTKRRLGAEVHFFPNKKNLLYVGEVNKALASFISSGIVIGVTYTPYTYSASWNVNGPKPSQKLSSTGRYRTSSSVLVPVPPNYFTVLDNKFLKVSRHVEAAERYSLSGVLYNSAEMNSLIVSSSAFNYLSMEELDTGVAILTNTITANKTSGAQRLERFAINSVGAIDLAPTVTGSSLPSAPGDMIASIPLATRMSGDGAQSALAVRIRTVHVRVPNKNHYEDVVDAISKWGMSTVNSISSITEATSDMDTAGGILKLFFIFTQIIILVICFFSLMSSMSSNVLNSSKEIAVLLCMGMTHWQVYRVFICEAFIVVLSSGLLGLLVGVVVAYTMQMQNVLYTELPLPFTFPYLQLCIVAAVGFLSALASSISPVAYLLGLPSITHILRRTIN